MRTDLGVDLVSPPGVPVEPRRLAFSGFAFGDMMMTAKVHRLK